MISYVCYYVILFKVATITSNWFRTLLKQNMINFPNAGGKTHWIVHAPTSFCLLSETAIVDFRCWQHSYQSTCRHISSLCAWMQHYVVSSTIFALWGTFIAENSDFQMVLQKRNIVNSVALLIRKTHDQWQCLLLLFVRRFVLIALFYVSDCIFDFVPISLFVI